MTQSSKALRISPLPHLSPEGWLRHRPLQQADFKSQPKLLLDPPGAPSCLQHSLLLICVFSTVCVMPSAEEPGSPGLFGLSPQMTHEREGEGRPENMTSSLSGVWWRGHSFWSLTELALPPVTSWVTLEPFFHLPEPQFSHL